MENKTTIKNGQSLARLFYHISNADGHFGRNEIEFIADLFVRLDLKENVDFKQEVLRYKDDASLRLSDKAYLSSLLADIRPVNLHAFFSWAVEIALCDGLLSAAEEKLLDDLAGLLPIPLSESAIIKKIFIERRVAEENGIF